MKTRFYILGAILFILAVLYYFFPDTIGIIFMVSAFFVFLIAPQQKGSFYWSIDNKYFIAFIIILLVGAFLRASSGSVEDFKQSRRNRKYNLENYLVLQLMKDNAPDKDIMEAINSGADITKADGIDIENVPVLLAIKNKRNDVLKLMLKKNCPTKIDSSIKEPILGFQFPQLTEAAEFAIVLKNPVACNLLLNDSNVKANPNIIKVAVALHGEALFQQQRYAIEGITKENLDTARQILDIVMSHHPDLNRVPEVIDNTLVYFNDKKNGSYQATFVYQNASELLNLFLKNGATPDKKAIELLLKEKEFYHFRKEIFNAFLESGKLDNATKVRFENILSEINSWQSAKNNLNDLVKNYVLEYVYNYYHYPGNIYYPATKTINLTAELTFNNQKKLSDAEITNNFGINEFILLEDFIKNCTILSDEPDQKVTVKVNAEKRAMY
jgi:hypothetical protein